MKELYLATFQITKPIEANSDREALIKISCEYPLAEKINIDKYSNIKVKQTIKE
jgi:hypothetical protein